MTDLSHKLANKRVCLFYLVALIFLSSIVGASDVIIPNTFLVNTPAVASQVNDNFTAVKLSVDDNDSRLEALEALVINLQAEITNQQSEITSNLSKINQLQTELTLLESNTVLSLDGMLRLSQVNGYDAAEFTAVNVVVNSGSGSTNAQVNGLGNLIIGYNESLFAAPEFCSDSEYTNSTDCNNNGHVWANNVKTGSHNLILGFANSYDNFGSIVTGVYNIVNGDFASVLGGVFNAANETGSSISGGFINSANAPYSHISGGQNNITTGGYSTVTGGANNTAQADHSNVNGGRGNVANGNFSSVTGGNNNTANGGDSTVSGGSNRTANDVSDWVAGSLLEDN